MSDFVDAARQSRAIADRDFFAKQCILLRKLVSDYRSMPIGPMTPQDAMLVLPEWKALAARADAILSGEAPTQEEAPKVVTENDAASGEPRTGSGSLPPGAVQTTAVQAATVTAPGTHLEGPGVTK